MNQEELAGCNELEECLKLWRTRLMITKKNVQKKSQEEMEEELKK